MARRDIAPDNPRDERHLGTMRLGDRQITSVDLPTAFKICEEVSQGRTLTEICTKENNFPTRMTFYRWMMLSPELARSYHAARELSAHSLEEEALGLAREIRGNPGTAQKVRAYDVAMGQLRWSASRRNPRVYSERAAIQITVPIQISTPLDMGISAGAGGPEIEGVYSLDATVSLPQDPQAEGPGVENDPRSEVGGALIPRPRSKKVRAAREGVQGARNAEAKASVEAGPQEPEVQSG